MKQIQSTIDIEITGIAPLVQDNLRGSEEQMKSKGKRNTNGVSNDEEAWKTKLYEMDNGKLGHPGEAVEQALYTAGRYFKADARRTMKDVLKSLVFVNEPYITLDKTKKDIKVQQRSFLNQINKTRGFVYRPLFDAGWKAKFSVILADTDIIEVPRLKEIFDFAGLRIGIGNGRPKFGRFMISSFQERK
jgi:hypothetical protein